jgi:hypothetical protein
VQKLWKLRKKTGWIKYWFEEVHNQPRMKENAILVVNKYLDLLVDLLKLFWVCLLETELFEPKEMSAENMEV